MVQEALIIDDVKFQTVGFSQPASVSDFRCHWHPL
jgi:hypothetical protein